MTDPRDYVPSDSLVRATIAPSTYDVDRCPTAPWNMRDIDTLMHVVECASCQAMLEAEAVERDGWDAAIAYVPSETLIAQVVTRSARPPFRLHLLDMPDVATRRRSLGARVATLFGVSELSPAVLAAAVVLHAAGAWLAGPTWAVMATVRSTPIVEHVTLVALPAVTAVQGAQTELATAVRQTMSTTSVTRGLSRRDLDHLDSTAAILSRTPNARIRLETDTSATARTAGELLRRYLMERGVSLDRSTIVMRGTASGRVTIVLDASDRPPR